MGKKKFISKGEGKKYYLLHRSQTDAAYAGEETPSDFVLVEQTHSFANTPKANKVEDLFKLGNHITADGFKNDGYDYSQHYKEMGGGKYIGADGQFKELPLSSKAVELPPELLPSGEELDRNLEAIVISEKYMDEDIRNALFEDGDDEGEFEELDDDFVLQAMAEPEAPDFDFDAHIAKLIAASQRDTEFVAGRPWKDTEELDEDGDEEEPEDEDELESVVVKVTAEQQAFIDEQFERTLEEYADSELGDVEEDEEDFTGLIDFEDGNQALEDAMDEFLKQQEEDRKYEHHPASRSKPDPTQASLIKIQTSLRRMQIEEEDRCMDPALILHDSAIRREELDDQIKKQEEAYEVILEVNEIIAKQSVDEAWNCQKYLSAERVTNEWDCETILSTYSTLDNHPAIIRDHNSKFQPHKSRFTRSTEREDEQRRINIKRNEDMLSQPNQQLVGEVVSSSNQVNRIVLSRKNNLPIGYGPTGYRTKDAINSPNDDMMEESDEDDASSQEQEPELDRTIKPITRPRDETAEGKKLRKQIAKETKRNKRQMKKEVKTVYKNEAMKQVNNFARQQDISHAHVFKTAA